MALRKALSNKRLYDTVKVTSITPLSAVMEHKTIVPPMNAAQAIFQREIITSSEKGFFRRFLHQSATSSRIPNLFSFLVGDKLKESIKGLSVNVEERLAGLSPPPAVVNESFYGISVKDVKKIMRASQVEKLRYRLREIPQSSVSFSKFRRICVEACESVEQAADFAKLLDDSGNALVLGNVVFLRSEQVAKSIESVISQTMSFPNDPRRKRAGATRKAKGDNRRKGQGLGGSRALRWAGLYGTAESWGLKAHLLGAKLGCDGAHLLLYDFRVLFNFEKTKQQRLMEVYKFDAQKYHQLRKLFYSCSD